MEASEGRKALPFAVILTLLKRQDEKKDFTISLLVLGRSQVKTNPQFSVCLEAAGISNQVPNKRAFVRTHDGALWSSGILIGNFSYLPISEHGSLGNEKGKDQEK